MRTILIIPVLLSLAACGKGDEAAQKNAIAPAPAPTSTAPPPKTPNVAAPVASGDNARWLEPRDNAGDPASAPYANLLDRPVVDAPPKR